MSAPERPQVTHPTVSVIVAAYAVDEFIGFALQSLVDQTFGDWEAIVVDDGSPDHQALMAAVQPFRSRITLLTQPNRGTAAARNAGLRVASGEWVAFLDADDLWMPTFLERQLAFARGSALDLIWSDGILIGDTVYAGARLSRHSPSRGPITVARLLNADVHVHNSSTLVRRSAVAAVGGFDETVKRAQDFDLWVRLLARGFAAGFNDEPLFSYRIHGANLSGDAMSRLEREQTVLQRLKAKGVLLPSDVAVLDARLRRLDGEAHALAGKRRLFDGDYDGARHELGKALRFRWSLRLWLATLGVRLAPGVVRWLARLHIPHEER